jgi:hypothetical protein
MGELEDGRLEDPRGGDGSPRRAHWAEDGGGRGLNMIRPIPRTFFEATRGEDSLQREYLRPNEAFFRSYVTFIYCKL